MFKSADSELSPYVKELIDSDNKFRYITSYLTTVKFHWVDAIETACAGDGFIFFNPEFWDKLTHEHKKTVLAHEIYHLMLNHLARSKGLDSNIYNQAADHVINNHLENTGFDIGPNVELGGILPCCDPQYDNMSTKQVYDNLIKNPEKQQSNGLNADDFDVISDLLDQVAQESNTETRESIKETNDENIDESAKKFIQNISYSLGESEISEVIFSLHSIPIQKVELKEIFKNYLIDPLTNGKRTFVRPSRRQIKGDLRLKGRYPKVTRSHRLTKLVYALDVSGSISQADASAFLSTAKTIKEKLNPKEMIIILWDTKIVYEKTFMDHEDISEIKIKAGGGTCLRPVYKRVAEIKPEALVIFTDLAVDIPPEPDCDVIWFLNQMHNYVHHYVPQVTYGSIYEIPKE